MSGERRPWGQDPCFAPCQAFCPGDRLHLVVHCSAIFFSYPSVSLFHLPRNFSWLLTLLSYSYPQPLHGLHLLLLCKSINRGLKFNVNTQETANQALGNTGGGSPYCSFCATCVTYSKKKNDNKKICFSQHPCGREKQYNVSSPGELKLLGIVREELRY